MLKDLNPGAGTGKAAGIDKYGRMAKRNKNFETVLSGIAVNKLNNNLSYAPLCRALQKINLLIAQERNKKSRDVKAKDRVMYSSN